MVRNEIMFGRQLSEDEAALLRESICWRRGSRVLTDRTGSVVGCIAHPDDVDCFQKRLRKLRRRSHEHDVS